jgi:hypothetical protein
LRETGLLAVGAHLVAQHAPMKWFGWHLSSRNQKVRQATTHYTVYLCLRSFREAFRKSRHAGDATDNAGSNRK